MIRKNEVPKYLSIWNVSLVQLINDELSVNFKCFGTKNIDDILNIVFGPNYIKGFITNENKDLYNIITIILLIMIINQILVQ